LQVKVSAIECNIVLQNSWIANVDNGAASKDELNHFNEKMKAYQAACRGSHVDESADLLGKQIGEVRGSIEQAQRTFENFHASNSQRNTIFSNFRKDANNENLEVFKNELLQHLSQTIVVKENRERYQKEQFDRLLISMQTSTLKNKDQTMAQFAAEYAKLIEVLIEQSHNWKCPKIQANYDDFNDATIKPLNSTIFYYFFSGDRMRRSFAQWMLASVRYPN